MAGILCRISGRGSLSVRTPLYMPKAPEAILRGLFASKTMPCAFFEKGAGSGGSINR
jgi:hypothetical protein